MLFGTHDVPLLIQATFFTINLQLYLHDICLVNVGDLFIPVIMLKTFKFKSSVSFRTYTLFVRGSRKLQHPAYLSRLTSDG